MFATLFFEIAAGIARNKKALVTRNDEGSKFIERTDLPATTSSLWHEQAKPIPGESCINRTA